MAQYKTSCLISLDAIVVIPHHPPLHLSARLNISHRKHQLDATLWFNQTDNTGKTFAK